VDGKTKAPAAGSNQKHRGFPEPEEAEAWRAGQTQKKKMEADQGVVDQVHGGHRDNRHQGEDEAGRKEDQGEDCQKERQESRHQEEDEADQKEDLEEGRWEEGCQAEGSHHDAGSHQELVEKTVEGQQGVAEQKEESHAWLQSGSADSHIVTRVLGEFLLELE
jgi:hypothetical protein